MNEIADLLLQIADGINPVTGEIFDINLCINNQEIRHAIDKLKKTYNQQKRTYSDYEDLYPGYTIIAKERFLYCAHNRSAEILNEILDYKLYTDDQERPSTGGPDIDKIANALHTNNKKFIIVAHNRIVCIFDNEHPFTGVPSDFEINSGQ